MSERRTKSRHLSEPLGDRPAKLLPLNHPAVVKGHTVYEQMVMDIKPDSDFWALKRGMNNRKIGDEVMKGRRRDFPIYTLAVEERATCPRTCEHWRSCYTNQLHRLQRMKHGPDLEARLELEVALLDLRHVGGFLVRLHVAGDFYSVEYVQLWRRLLDQYPTLRIWGYTRRWDDGDPIAAALKSLADNVGFDRFALRLSGAPSAMGRPVATVIEHAGAKPAGAIICPEQVAKPKRPDSCSVCAYCWHSKGPVAFIQH